MKTIKPQKVGVVQRPFEIGGRAFLGLGVPLFFTLDEPHRLLPEVELWKFLAEQIPGVVFDAGIPKAKAEYIVAGRAFAPGNQPCTACHVRVGLGDLEKLLFVTGPRRWRDGVATPSEPFRTMPITWENAYGGPRYAHNPKGRGHEPVERDGFWWHELPTVEAPGRLIASPRDEPGAAGFLPIEQTLPARQRLAGTYDKNWLETRFPGFADDLSWAYFNVAPVDQQREGEFTGSETFVIENMHPEYATLEGKLPGFRARAFVRQGQDSALREVSLRLDTLWLFPEHRRAVAVFHGMQQLAEEDAADVKLLVLACEAVDDPKPTAHYEQVVAKRADPEKGRFEALRDSDLLPARVPSDTPTAASGEGSGFDTMAARLRARGAREIEAARELVSSLGLDPDEHAPPRPAAEPPTPTLEELPEMLAGVLDDSERLQREVGAKQSAIEVKLKAECEAVGVSWPKIEKEFSAPSLRAADFSATREMDQLRALAADCRAAGVDPAELEEYLEDPEFRKRLELGAENFKRSQRLTAHTAPKPPRLELAATIEMRQRVLQAYQAGESLAGWDLTGVALAGFALRGVDLQGAFLENADLAGCDLSDADLRGAVLSHADLTEANLTGARLVGANVGSACLLGARLGSESQHAADASGAVFSKADLRGADLRGVLLKRAELAQANLSGTRLEGAQAPETAFIECDLSNAQFAGAALSRAAFLESRLDGTVFDGADLGRAVFVGSSGAGVTFRAADLTRAVFAMQPCLAGADFMGAGLEGANLRGAVLSGAEFSNCRLKGADLSEAALDGARFFRADLREARLIRARLSRANLMSCNLMDAILQKADLSGARLDAANLFRADLGRAVFSSDTTIEGALVNQVQVLPRRALG